MGISKLSKSLFEKNNLSLFVSLLIGILSVPILLFAVYQPQNLSGLAMLSDEDRGVPSFYTSGTTSTTQGSTNGSLNQAPLVTEKPVNPVNQREDECYNDSECGKGQICKTSGGANRCVNKAISTSSPASQKTSTPAPESINECQTASDCRRDDGARGKCISTSAGKKCQYPVEKNITPTPKSTSVLSCPHPPIVTCQIGEERITVNNAFCESPEMGWIETAKEVCGYFSDSCGNIYWTKTEILKKEACPNMTYNKCSVDDDCINSQTGKKGRCVYNNFKEYKICHYSAIPESTSGSGKPYAFPNYCNTHEDCKLQEIDGENLFCYNHQCRVNDECKPLPEDVANGEVCYNYGQTRPRKEYYCEENAFNGKPVIIETTERCERVYCGGFGTWHAVSIKELKCNQNYPTRLNYTILNNCVRETSSGNQYIDWACYLFEGVKNLF